MSTTPTSDPTVTPISGPRRITNRAVPMDGAPKTTPNPDATPPSGGARRPVTNRRRIAGDGDLTLVTGGWPTLAGPWDTVTIPTERDFGGDDFLADPMLDKLGRALIAQHSGYLSSLRPFRVAYRWKRKGGAKGEHATLGKCLKLSGLAKHAVRADFVIWVAADHLKELDCRNWHLEALMFHEHLHAGADEEGRPILHEHDFTGFRDELAVYGPWSTDLHLAHEEFTQVSVWQQSFWGPLGSTVPLSGAA